MTRGHRPRGAGVFGLLAFTLAMAFLPGCLSEETKTDADFRDEASRRAYVQSYFPVPVPPAASSFRFRYDRWQEWNFTGSFALPADDMPALAETLAPYATEQPDVYSFAEPSRHRAGQITLDPYKGRVRFHVYQLTGWSIPTGPDGPDGPDDATGPTTQPASQPVTASARNRPAR